MPPPGNLRPPPSEFDVVTARASCDELSPAYPTGLVASRPVFEAPASPPEGAVAVPLTADGFVVASQTVDLYENFFFASVVEEEVFVRRFEASIDKSRVVHHITLHYDDDSDQYLYAWAPGTGAVEFPEGGLRIGPDSGFRVEIHYNNLTEADEADDSGIVMWVEPAVGTEYAMLDPATFSIQVPANGTGSATVECVAESDFEIVAGMPHMHEIGDTFSHTVTRADGGETETLIELEGWSFDLQFFYAMPMEIKQGDTLTLECGYVNGSDRTVTAGTGTTNEMCYDFIYVTPASASLDCGNGFGRGR